MTNIPVTPTDTYNLLIDYPMTTPPTVAVLRDLVCSDPSPLRQKLTTALINFFEADDATFGDIESSYPCTVAFEVSGDEQPWWFDAGLDQCDGTPNQWRGEVILDYVPTY